MIFLYNSHKAQTIRMTTLVTLTISLLTGCAGSGGMSDQNAPMQTSATPVNLLAHKTSSAVTGASTTTSATNTAAQIPPATSLAPHMMVSVKRSLNQTNIRRAIRNYQISKNLATGPYRVMGADLNSNGKGEAIVLFTGKDWCAPTGCTLVIFKQTDRGYRPISITRRVKAPILVARSSAYGWRGITVDTGITNKTLQSVVLRFNGSGYPGNATRIQRIPGRGGDKGELIIGADANPVEILEPQISQIEPQATSLRPSNP